MIYRKASELDFDLVDLPGVLAPARVLMTAPTHFQVEYVINPHMAGNIGDVDTQLAHRQWSELREAYAGLGVDTHVIQGLEGLPDMVFCANQCLPVPAIGAAGPQVILSRMYSEHRRPEVGAYGQFFGSHGYEVRTLKEGKGSFEGMGDAIWHPGRLLLWGGHGFRTDAEVYERLSEELGVPVLTIRLEDPDFYHLDTCMSVLDEQTVLIFPGAYDEDGLSMIRALFEHVIEAPETESRTLFACNAHCPDRKHVLIQRGCNQTNAALKAAGFEPVEVDTDEFLKSGGSVFCMKQMFW